MGRTAGESTTPDTDDLAAWKTTEHACGRCSTRRTFSLFTTAAGIEQCQVACEHAATISTGTGGRVFRFVGPSRGYDVWQSSHKDIELPYTVDADLGEDMGLR